MFSVSSLTLVASFGDARDRVGAELEGHALDSEQRLVLLDERVARLGQVRLEIFGAQGIELDPDRETALQFGDQVGGFAHVERAGRDEQDVVGVDRPVLRVDGAPFDDREDVALDALARDVGPPRPSRPATLSISSMKTIPFSPARRSASRLTASMSISLFFFRSEEFGAPRRRSSSS